AQSFIDDVEALDHVISTQVQSRLLLRLRRLLDRATRWFVHHEVEHTPIETLVERYRGPVQQLSPKVPDLVVGVGREKFEAEVDQLVGEGVPTALARRAAALLDDFVLLDIVELARDLGEDVEDVAAAYYYGGAQIGLGRMLDAIAELPRDDRWDALARGAVRDDAYAVLADLTRDVLAESEASQTTQERWQQWAQRHSLAVERARAAVTGVQNSAARLAPMSVALRTMRSLTRAAAGERD
ncbi:MAG: NAD-glutamate dehydrogenase, partial [Dermacoccus nishinomiyaensis]